MSSSALYRSTKNSTASRHPRDVLANRIVDTWNTRAQVKQDIPTDIVLVDERLDFPLDELPFHYETWKSKYGKDTLSKISSLAWLAFNQKVISIESNLLVPCCKVLMDDAFAHKDVFSVELLAQAQTDEAFHVLMAHKAMCICIEHRALGDISFPKSRIIKEYEKYEQSETVGWKKKLNIIAATIVTEVLINGYLAPISRDYKIQEFNRYITNMHLIDESAHGSVFRILAHNLLKQLDNEEREFFIDRMRVSIGYFNDIDLDIWKYILIHCGITPTANEIDEIRAAQTPNDYRELDKMIKEASEDIPQ